MDPPREGTEGAVEIPQVAPPMPPSAAMPDVPPSAAVPDVPPSAAVPARRRSAVVRLLLVVTIVATLGALATARIFLWPPSDTPTSADAVVILSGDHGERLPRALALMSAGVARTLVHDGVPDSAEARELCEKPQKFEVICLRPDPDSTAAEAYAVGRLALNRDWKTVVVVTSTQHVARAGLLFRRCVPASIEMVRARPAFGWRLTAHLIVEEWVKLAYSVTVHRGC